MSAERQERAADDALRAIAEPRRRAILRLVARDELAAGEIAAAFDVTRTAVSQHLTVLKKAGLVTERRDGTRRLYRARADGLAGLREYLDDMWAGSLDAARRIAEAERGADDEQATSAHENGQRAFRLHETAASGKVGADELDARRAWLASFWALVLRRFLDHAHGTSEPTTGSGRREEDK